MTDVRKEVAKWMLLNPVEAWALLAEVEPYLAARFQAHGRKFAGPWESSEEGKHGDWHRMRDRGQNPVANVYRGDGLTYLWDLDGHWDVKGQASTLEEAFAQADAALVAAGWHLFDPNEPRRI